MAAGSVTRAVVPWPSVLSITSRPAVHLHDVLHDGEPEPRASQLARAGPIDAEEALGQTRHVLARNADARIRDGELERGKSVERRRLRVDRDAAALGRVLDRVVDQIDEHLSQAVAVGVCVGRAGRDGGGERQAPLGRAIVQDLDHVVDHGVDGDGAQAQRHAPELEVGEGEQVVDQAAEALGMTVDHLQEAERRLATLACRPEQRLGVSLDRRERGAQLVRDVRDEVPPHGLETAQLGDVVQHEHQAERRSVLGGEPGAVHLQRAPVAERDVTRDHRLPAGELTRDLGDAGMTHEIDERAPGHDGPGRETEELARPRVRQHDPAVEVGDEHALHHAAQDRLEPLALHTHRGERGLDVARHVAEPALEHAEAVAALGTDRRWRRAGGERGGEADHAIDASAHRAREQPRDAEADDHRGGEPGRERGAQAQQVLGERADRHRGADHPHVAVVLLAPRDVEEPPVERRAPAHRVALARAHRAPDLGSIGVVREGRRGLRRLAEHRAVGADHREARVEACRRAPRRLDRGRVPGSTAARCSPRGPRLAAA